MLMCASCYHLGFFRNGSASPMILVRSGREHPHDHKVCIHKEYHSVCPLVRIGTRPPPFPQAIVPPRNQRGGGHTHLWVRGESQFRNSAYSMGYPVGKAVSETTNRQIESVNRERESVVTLLSFGIHYRISLSTITFEFRTISVSVSPLIFLQR
jgi:hypothetical protein